MPLLSLLIHALLEKANSLRVWICWIWPIRVWHFGNNFWSDNFGVTKLVPCTYTDQSHYLWEPLFFLLIMVMVDFSDELWCSSLNATIGPLCSLQN